MIPQTDEISLANSLDPFPFTSSAEKDTVNLLQFDGTPTSASRTTLSGVTLSSRSLKLIKEMFADFLSEQAIVRSQRRQGVQLFILGIVGIVLTIIELELVWDGKHSHNTPEAEVLKCLISFFTALLIFFLYRYYLFLSYLQRRDYGLTAHVNFLFSPQLRYKFALEVAVCVVHPIPGLAYLPLPDNLGFFWDEALGLFMFCRLYLALRVVRDYSKLSVYRRIRSTSRRNAQLEFNWTLVLKEIFGRRPFFFVLFTLSTMILCLGYCNYVSERNAQPAIYGRFFNALYVTVITMTTVGYGVIHPISTFGKITACITAYTGLICTSMLTAVLIGRLSLSSHEKRVLHRFKLASLRKKEKHFAAKLIQLYWRRHLFLKDEGHKTIIERWQNETEFFQHETEIIKKLRKCRRMKRALSTETDAQTQGYQNVLNKLQDLERKLDVFDSIVKSEVKKMKE